jgi:flavin reductase (DIM6/NTAB) family NADH-FMN oxidoreductase RutF
VAAGTHTIFVGEVESVRLEGDAEALVYHDRDYHRLTGV